MNNVKVGGKVIGEGQPVFLIAEIGYNFNTLDEAKASIHAAVASGADAVKFQTFRADTLTSRLTDFPAEDGPANQWDEAKQYEMSLEAHQELFAYARELGTIVFSTPSHADDVDLLEQLDVQLYKIGSDDLTNLPLYKYIAEKGKPIIFSTGMGTLGQVEEAVNTIRAAGNDQIVILHCISNYPIKDPTVVNLRAISTMQQAFGTPVGYSDHTTTFTAALGAVALGAAAIERHFTIDKKLDTPDAFFAADPEEMKALAAAIREMEECLGTGVKRPAPTEIDMQYVLRKSAVTCVNIKKGEVITSEMFGLKRPGTGIPANLAHLVVGRQAKQDIPEDEVITWEMV